MALRGSCLGSWLTVVKMSFSMFSARIAAPENDLQKLHDKYIKQLENLMDEKEKEIMTV